MPGYPARISRASLGPEREDFLPPPNDVHYRRASFFNLADWQLAGLNVVAERAGGLIDGANGVLLAHEEAWHPNGGNGPTFSKEATGHYRLVYAATYPDETGEDVAVGLSRARAEVQGSTPLLCICEVTTGTQVDVRVFELDGSTPADATVWFRAF